MYGGGNRSGSSEVKNVPPPKVLVKYPGSQKYKRADTESIVNSLLGRFFVIPERVSDQLLGSLPSGLEGRGTRRLLLLQPDEVWGEMTRGGQAER